MVRKRIIPTLLVSNGKLVKTKNFQHYKYVGDVVNAIKIFNEKEVDELILIDIEASKNSSSINYKLIENCATECFMPLCYGGGIKNIDDATRLFSLGIEKISLQSSIIENPIFLSELSSKFGNQAIVVSLDFRKDFFGNYRLINSSNGKVVKVDLSTFIRQIESLGGGEILLNSINKDGNMNGMDLEIIKKITSITNLPLIALGGVGSLKDIKDAFDVGASAVAAGSFFVFNGPYRAVLITYPNQIQINKLNSEL
jgi:cyclase